MKAQNNELLKKAYMFLYDQFAADTSKVEKELGVDRKETLKVLKKLQKMDLVNGEFTDHRGMFSPNRRAFVGTNMMWQCQETWDSEERHEAEARIDKALAPQKAGG
jgi:hypothetical protein